MTTVSGEPDLVLGAAFPAVDRAAWRRAVDKVLAEGARDLTADELDRRYERTLVTTTIDGLRIEPLYVADDLAAVPASGYPGQPPYVRGSRALGRRRFGWDVRQRILVPPDGAGTSEQARGELERGTTQLALDLSRVDPTADLLDHCLDGVHLDLVPIALDASPSSAAADALVELWARRGVEAADAQAVLGLDPVGGWLRAGGARDLAADLHAATEWARRTVSDFPNVVGLIVDAALLHECGGGDVEELGGSIAWGVDLLRTLVDAGLPVDTAARQIEFRYAATTDQFLTIAKLRAARRLWQRVVAVAGGGTAAQRQRQHATTSRAATARYDVWVNLLRATVGCFAAGVGGADSITVVPHDDLVEPGGSVLGRRLARNVALVLVEESNLARVVDLAGGSYYVEHLTEQLAAAAWRWLQELEHHGGFLAAARADVVQERIAAVAAARDAAVARRAIPLTGVSEFPDVTETPPPPVGARGRPERSPRSGPVAALRPRRDAEPFEVQRGRADARERSGSGRPSVFLANLGSPAVHTARATFAKNLFEVGGFAAAAGPGADDVDELVAQYHASGARLVCLCSNDDLYTDLAVPAARALVATDPRPARLYLAGRPRDLDAQLADAGVDEQVVAGCDVLDVITRAHDLLDQLDRTDAAAGTRGAS